MIRLRVVTYNVHKCRGMDGRQSALRVAEVLQELGADVIALQEVLEHQAQAISARLRLPFVLGENRKHRGYPYGNVVLSRFPIRRMRNYDLSVQGREERGCLRADLLVDGGALLHIFNVHLGTALIERRHQGRMLVAQDLLNDVEIQAPRIVLGDFNEWTTGLATRLLRAHLKSADLRLHLRRRRTYPGVMPFLHLDHIYHDPQLRLDKLSLYRTRKSLVASDHLPLVADFSWPAEKR
ncbi:MAG TPA: endonuclease/exonuclease/phosphatase family protein [Bryobacteraceae bacterium]|nr:endonuclease/exonuclease/phosphatase family protein [Bryobacteraceae bacterium]